MLLKIPAITELLGRFPGLSLAQESNSQEVQALFDETPMKIGNASLLVSRGRDFFALNRIQGQECLSVVQRNASGEVIGFCAVVVRPAYVQGQVKHIAYSQDLRVSRKAKEVEKRVIFEMYSAFVNYIEVYLHDEHFAGLYTAVLDGNKHALSAFSRESFPLYYQRLSNYSANFFLGLGLRAAASLSGVSKILKISGKKECFKFTLASEGDERELRLFLEDRNKAKHLGYCFRLNDVNDHWEQVLSKEPRFSISCFSIARDEQGKIVGCCALIDFSHLRIWQIRFSSGPKLQMPLHSITHFEVHEGLPRAHRNQVAQELLAFALRQYRGPLRGLVQSVFQDSRFEISSLSLPPHLTFKGGIYRVSHPSHAKKHEHFFQGYARWGAAIGFEVAYG